MDKYKELGKKLYLRGAAALASPDVYEYLEAKGILYSIRFKANNNLHREIEHLMTRLVEPFSYQVASWARLRRVAAKMEWHAGELFPRVGVIFTGQRESMRPRGDMERSVGEHGAECSQPCQKGPNRAMISAFQEASRQYQLKIRGGVI